MNKLKIVWQNVWTFVKKHWLLCAGSFGFIVLVILFLPIFRSSWLLYPESLRARIAIIRLANSKEAGIYCREDCAAKRLMYKNIISAALINEKEKLLPDLESKILDARLLPEVRRLFLQIWQESGLEPSDKIRDYCGNKENSFEIRLELVATWPQLAGNSYEAEIIGNIKMAKTEAEKIELLGLLRGRSEQIVMTTIWDLILGEASNDVKAKAWFLLANVENKQQAYLADDLDKLRAVLESGDYPHRLKDQAILVIADYYSYFPMPSEALLIDVVNRPKYFDDYQRSFAIDILNRNRNTKLLGPELTEADWASYFNN